METTVETKTDEFGIQTTVRVTPKGAGLYTVAVIHKFPSGNYMGETYDNQSEVSARAMLTFYTT